MAKLRVVLWVCAGLMAVLGGALWLWTEKPARLAGGVAGADIGGPFQLVRHDGTAVTEADFRGRYMLMYFGYTYCPDVCPTSLQVMVQALNAMPAEVQAKITPVFVTVDPARDTVEAVAAYVKAFDPRLVGLTGPEAQVSAAAKAFRVYYAKTRTEAASDYLVDHTSLTYLMGPDGGLRAFYRHGTSAEAIAAGVTEIVSGEKGS